MEKTPTTTTFSRSSEGRHNVRREFGLAAARIMRLAAEAEAREATRRPSTLHPCDGQGDNLAFVDDDGEPT